MLTSLTSMLTSLLTSLTSLLTSLTSLLTSLTIKNFKLCLTVTAALMSSVSGGDLCGNSSLCTSYYSPSVPSTGCFLQWLQLSSAVCCSLKVLPQPGQMFRAVRLGVPSVLATFKTVLKDTNGEVVDSRMFNVNLNTGALIDWYISIVISSAGPTTLLSPGWYVTRDVVSPTSSHQLIAGLDLNSLHSWDVTKPGWIKAGARPGQFLSHNLDQLTSHFRPDVTDCGAGHLKASFSRVFIDRTELGGREVRQEFPFISRVRVWERYVELEHSQERINSRCNERLKQKLILFM